CLAEPAVLELKILQALHLLALQPAKLLAPPIIVTSLTPIWRIASTMFWPCETRTSTCRSFATISSGLYRFLAIAVLLDVKDIPQVGPLQWGWVTTTPMGKLVFQLTGAFAEFERTMIRQRIKAGLKRAVAQGVKLGRPKIDSATERKVRKQLTKGIGILKVAKSLGLGTGTVQRISNELR